MSEGLLFVLILTICGSCVAIAWLATASDRTPHPRRRRVEARCSCGATFSGSSSTDFMMWRWAHEGCPGRWDHEECPGTAVDAADDGGAS